MSTALYVDGRRPLLTVVKLLGRHRGRMTAALVAGSVREVALWFLPFVTASIIDIVVARGEPRAVLIWAAVASVMLLQNYPTHLLYTRNFATVVRETGATLRNSLTERLQSLSIGYHARASATLAQSKVVRDVENVELMLLQSLHPLISATMVLLGATLMTALTVPEFLPFYLLTIPIALLIRHVVLGRSNVGNERLRREMEGFSARVGEMATLIPITRAHGLERTAIDRVAASAQSVRRAGFDLDMLNGRVASFSFVTMQFLGLGCLVAAALFTLGDILPISAGEVVLLSTYFTMLTGSIASLLMLLPVAARGFESVRSIAEVLEDPDLELNDDKKVADVVGGSLRLEQVSFRYPGADADALTEIDIEITSGESVAFVGSSGSGKSTLLNLVLGFLRPTGGRILLDGVDMQDLDLRTVRRFVSVVPQESVLFEGSIRENVAYGLGEVGDERVRSALADANALDIVDAFPDGWHTVVGERGARLSGGQRQRIAIARALIREPRILLLDEATSALDPDSENEVKIALARLMRHRTTLVVAHRLSTIRSADRIVVLEHGRIVEIGPHGDLLRRGGRYAHLHARQFGAVTPGSASP